MMISNEYIDRYIDNQYKYYNKYINTKRNIMREAKIRYNLFLLCSVNKKQYEETKRHLFKVFVKETINKVIEINSNYKPPTIQAHYVEEDDTYYFE